MGRVLRERDLEIFGLLRRFASLELGVLSLLLQAWKKTKQM